MFWVHTLPLVFNLSNIFTSSNLWYWFQFIFVFYFGPVGPFISWYQKILSHAVRLVYSVILPPSSSSSFLNSDVSHQLLNHLIPMMGESSHHPSNRNFDYQRNCPNTHLSDPPCNPKSKCCRGCVQQLVRWAPEKDLPARIIIPILAPGPARRFGFSFNNKILSLVFFQFYSILNFTDMGWKTPEKFRYLRI